MFEASEPPGINGFRGNMQHFFGSAVEEVGSAFEDHPYQPVTFETGTDRAFGFRSRLDAVRQKKSDPAVTNRTVAGQTEGSNFSSCDGDGVPVVQLEE